MSREKHLHRELLPEAVREICSGRFKEFKVSELFSKGGKRHRIEVEADGLSFHIDFHFKDNGSTSIDISSGRHPDIKKEFMRAILNEPKWLKTHNSPTE